MVENATLASALVSVEIEGLEISHEERPVNISAAISLCAWRGREEEGDGGGGGGADSDS